MRRSDSHCEAVLHVSCVCVCVLIIHARLQLGSNTPEPSSHYHVHAVSLFPPRARFSDTLIEMSAPLKLIWLMQNDIKASLLLCYLHGVDWDILLFICFSGFDHIPFTK